MSYTGFSGRGSQHTTDPEDVASSVGDPVALSFLRSGDSLDRARAHARHATAGTVASGRTADPTTTSRLVRARRPQGHPSGRPPVTSRRVVGHRTQSNAVACALAAAHLDSQRRQEGILPGSWGDRQLRAMGMRERGSPTQAFLDQEYRAAFEARHRAEEQRRAEAARRLAALMDARREPPHAATEAVPGVAVTGGGRREAFAFLAAARNFLRGPAAAPSEPESGAHR